MTTSSHTPAATLYESETKSIVLPGNISPIVESSSTATLESTTAQVSSQSSSPLNTATFYHQETTKAVSLQFSLSPLSTSLASSPIVAQTSHSPFSCVSTTSNSKLATATSISRFSPTRSPPSESITLLPQQRQQQIHTFTNIFHTEIHKETKTALLLHKQFLSETNMLTPTSTSSVTSISQQSNPTVTSTTTAAAIPTSTSNSPIATAATCVSSLSPSSCHINNNSNNNNGIQNLKCDTSPSGGLLTTENSNSQQRQMDETGNKINSGATPESLHGGRDASSVMQRKNSNSSIISNVGCIHASPTLSSNNNNENSNSSNSTISQLMDAVETSSSNGQQQQKQSQETKSSSKVVSKTSSTDDANDDNVNINASGSGNFINAQCTSKENSSSSTSSSSSMSSSVSTKDQAEMQAVLGNLANVKKEQGNVDTPEMSPDGFGSLSSLTTNNAGVPGVGASTGTPATSMNDILGNSGSGNVILGRNNNNTNKSSNMVGGSVGTTCISSLLNDETSNGQQSLNHNNNSNFGGNISIMPTNSMDYMQQQNHIFVFSTQLANKGAESVLSGQFPTIIAYHCTQPATKKFLEDFFLKNPMKMAKIQRQNLNMAISVSAASHQWMSGSSTGGTSISTKSSQKLNGRGHIGSANTVNNHICNNIGLDGKSASSASNTTFSDTTNPLSTEAADLMSWEQTNIGLDGISSNSNAGHSIKMSEGSDTIAGSPHNNSVANTTSITQQSPNKPIGLIGNATAPVSPNDSLQPSLQGVKVPDENLTPQQRQHREEQLAKLKKMNQFLFPEHGSDLLPDAAALQASNQLGKLNADAIIGNSSGSTSLAGMLGDSSSSSPGISGAGNQITNSRGSSNMIGLGRASASMSRNSLNMSSAPTDDNGIPTGIIGGPGDMGNMHCGNPSTVPSHLIINSQQGLPCGPSGLLGVMGPSALGGGGNHQGGILPHGSMVPGSMNSMQNCGSSGAPSSSLMLQGGPSKGGMSGANQLDIGGGPSSQIEWSKMQQQFYEERTTKNKCSPDVISGLCRSISTVGGGSYVRSGQPVANVSSSAMNSAGGPSVRSQGPPPPYHPTQRSASVPIATQSPNPASPNNPTSNLSLPSPRTASGTCGTNLNSPSSDNLVQAASVTTSTTSVGTTATVSAATSNASNQCQTFPQQDSPTGQNSNGLGGSSNSLRNNLNQFNSNPSTPLSNMSPKDLENMGTGITDAKNPRPSPQRSRTPHGTGSNSTDSTNMESRFPPASPGISFPSHLQNPASGSKISNGSNENPSFGRRPDNLPLNPNSNRTVPIKQNLHFDPISSLAQMSQQLTSCVSSNGGVNGPSSVGISNSMSSEMAGSQNMEGLLGPGGPIDGGIDHCGNVTGGAAGMGLPPHMLGSGQYGAGSCHMSGPIISPMSSRVLAPKMGSGVFGGTGPGIMREGPTGFHGGMPSHRMMGRMGLSFCPFNGSPNIQVKASTPNTIQYMPVRPQTSNTNPRVPPSLEFLQRFANPQLAGSPNIDGPMMGGSGPSGNADMNKMGNTPLNAGMQNSGMNFFSNCNQINSGNNAGNTGGGNQVDMAAGMMPGHSDIGGVMNIGNPTGGMNIRGMRSVRQGTMGPGGSPVGGLAHRIQGPGSHIIGGPGGINQFGNNSHEAMDCVNTSDQNGMFGNAPGGPNQIFGQQKGSTMGGQTHCQSMSPGNVGMNGPVGNTGIGTNEQGSPMQAQINGPGMLGPNSSGTLVGGNGLVPGSVSGSPNNGPVNYKSYLGPSTNDLKYAQQYHNFQQQLYATSTRSQISQQMGGAPPMGLSGGGINAGVPTNANPGFFVSK